MRYHFVPLLASAFPQEEGRTRTTMQNFNFSPVIYKKHQPLFAGDSKDSTEMIDDYENLIELLWKTDSVWGHSHGIGPFRIPFEALSSDWPFSDSVWGTFLQIDPFRIPFEALFFRSTLFGFRLRHFLQIEPFQFRLRHFSSDQPFSDSVWGTFPDRPFSDSVWNARDQERIKCKPKWKSCFKKQPSNFICLSNLFREISFPLRWQPCNRFRQPWWPDDNAGSATSPAVKLYREHWLGVPFPWWYNPFHLDEAKAWRHRNWAYDR